MPKNGKVMEISQENSVTADEISFVKPKELRSPLKNYTNFIVFEKSGSSGTPISPQHSHPTKASETLPQHKSEKHFSNKDGNNVISSAFRLNKVHSPEPKYAKQELDDKSVRNPPEKIEHVLQECEGEEEETFEDAEENKFSLTLLAEDLNRIHLSTPGETCLGSADAHEFSNKKQIGSDLSDLDVYCESFEDDVSVNSTFNRFDISESPVRNKSTFHTLNEVIEEKQNHQECLNVDKFETSKGLCTLSATPPRFFPENPEECNRDKVKRACPSDILVNESKTSGNISENENCTFRSLTELNCKDNIPIRLTSKLCRDELGYKLLDGNRSNSVEVDKISVAFFESNDNHNIKTEPVVNIVKKPLSFVIDQVTPDTLDVGKDEVYDITVSKQADVDIKYEHQILNDEMNDLRLPCNESLENATLPTIKVHFYDASEILNPNVEIVNLLPETTINLLCISGKKSELPALGNSEIKPHVHEVQTEPLLCNDILICGNEVSNFEADSTCTISNSSNNIDLNVNENNVTNNADEVQLDTNIILKNWKKNDIVADQTDSNDSLFLENTQKNTNENCDLIQTLTKLTVEEEEVDDKIDLGTLTKNNNSDIILKQNLSSSLESTVLRSEGAGICQAARATEEPLEDLGLNSDTNYNIQFDGCPKINLIDKAEEPHYNCKEDVSQYNLDFIKLTVSNISEETVSYGANEQQKDQMIITSHLEKSYIMLENSVNFSQTEKTHCGSEKGSCKDERTAKASGALLINSDKIEINENASNINNLSIQLSKDFDNNFAISHSIVECENTPALVLCDEKLDNSALEIKGENEFECETKHSSSEIITSDHNFIINYSTAPNACVFDSLTDKQTYSDCFENIMGPDEIPISDTLVTSQGHFNNVKSEFVQRESSVSGNTSEIEPDNDFIKIKPFEEISADKVLFSSTKESLENLENELFSEYTQKTSKANKFLKMCGKLECESSSSSNRIQMLEVVKEPFIISESNSNGNNMLSPDLSKEHIVKLEYGDKQNTNRNNPSCEEIFEQNLGWDNLDYVNQPISPTKTVDEPIASTKTDEVHQPIASTKLVEIDQPVTSTKTVEADQPIASTKTVEVDQPLAFTKTVEIDQPIAPTKTVDEPIASTKTNEVDHPVTSTKTVEIDQPIASNKTVDADQPIATTKIVEVDQPIASTNTVEVDQPITSTKTVEVDQPIATTKTVEFDQPVVSSNTVEVDKPIVSTKTVEGYELIVSTKMVEADQPIESTKTVTEVLDAVGNECISLTLNLLEGKEQDLKLTSSSVIDLKNTINSSSINLCGEICDPQENFEIQKSPGNVKNNVDVLPIQNIQNNFHFSHLEEGSFKKGTFCEMYFEADKRYQADDSVEFDDSLAEEAANISKHILNLSQEMQDYDSDIDSNRTIITLDVGNKQLSNTSEMKKPLSSSSVEFLELIEVHDQVTPSSQFYHDSVSVESFMQSMRAVLPTHLNQSEAGPITADELRTQDLDFQDGANLDLDYFTRAGDTEGVVRDSLIRDSLYIKFDPIVGAVVSKTISDTFTMPPPSLPDVEKHSEEATDSKLSESKTIERGDSQKTPGRSPALEAVQKLISLTPPSASSGVATPIKSDRASVGTTSSVSPKISPEHLKKELKKLEELMKDRETYFENELDKKHADLEKKEKEIEASTLRRIELEAELKAATERESRLKKEVQERTKSKQQLSLVMEEYEKTISQLVAQKEEEKKEFEVQKDLLMKERDTAMQHLNNMEIAFNDVHQKYERSKTVIEGMKANEDILKKSLSEYDDAIKTSTARYDSLKNHAIRQLETANQELDVMRRSHQAELAKLKAMLKKAEVRVTSLEESLEQKSKENQELAAICDELINKVGSGST